MNKVLTESYNQALEDALPSINDAIKMLAGSFVVTVIKRLAQSAYEVNKKHMQQAQAMKRNAAVAAV